MEGYRQVPFPGFGGGLNLREQPDVVKPDQAIDLLNVSFTDQGAVKQRDGYGLFTTSVGTNRYDSLSPYYTSAGGKSLVAGAGNRLEVIDTAGAVAASNTGPTASPHFFARFGGPTAEVVYMANGTDTVRKLSGTTFSTPAYTGTTPTGMFLAVTPTDNRLVNARFVGTTGGSNPSTVRFSDAGLPETMTANNYVQIAPGDGEAITGLAAWREFLFVFKESKFAVFYGTSTDTTGQPIFNYRMVDTGIGAVSPRAIAVARDGVYFLDRKGVYVTRGQEPQLVSKPLDPFFLGGLSPFFLSPALSHANLTNSAMTWHEHRLYLAVTTSGASVNDRMLVLDTEQGWWTLYDIPAAALTPFRVGSQTELVFALSSGTKDLGRHSSAYQTDNTQTIASRWRSGWYDYDSTAEKTLREAKVWGKGAVNVAWSKDFQGSQTQTALDFDQGVDTWGAGTADDLWGTGTGSDLWGSGVVYAPRLVRRAIRGTVFSLLLSNYLDNTWTVARLTSHLREARIPSTLQTET